MARLFTMRRAITVRTTAPTRMPTTSAAGPQSCHAASMGSTVASAPRPAGPPLACALVPSDASRPRRTWPQRGVLAFNSLVIVGTLAAAGLIWTANDTLSDTRRVVIHSGASDGTSPPSTAGQSGLPTNQTTTTLDLGGAVEAKNYLIVGSDSRDCIDPASPYAGAFLTEGSDIGDRSDTIMVLRVDPDESQAAILSFPRDLWVRIGSTNRKSRINSAFDKEDPGRLVETIEENFSIPVDHYIEVDFCAFKYLVDAVGGVKIPFEYATRDRYTGLDITEPGCYTMTGDAALAYVRSRHYQYRGGRPLEGGRLQRPGPHPPAAGLHQADAAQGDRPRRHPPDVAKKLIDTARRHVRIDEDPHGERPAQGGQPPAVLRRQRGCAPTGWTGRAPTSVARR